MNPIPFIDRLSNIVGKYVCWFYLLAVIFSVYEVISDFVFDKPTIWVHDLTIMLCSACFLLGGAYAMQRQQHIRITVIYDLLSPATRRWLDMLTLALGLFFLILLSYFATKAAVESIGLVERSGRAWDFPMPMVVRIFFCLGSILFSLQVASHLWLLIRGRPLPVIENEPDNTVQGK